MSEPVGLKREVLNCAKAKILDAKAASARGDYEESLRISREARDLAQLVSGWNHLEELLLEQK